MTTTSRTAAELDWSVGMSVRAEGAVTVAHAGVVLPLLLADRAGLTRAFTGAQVRAGFSPGRERRRTVTDTVAAPAPGASCLSDVEAMTGQRELFGPVGGASDTTVLRGLRGYTDRLGGKGVPGRRLSRAVAQVRSRVWSEIAAQHGGIAGGVGRESPVGLARGHRPSC